MWVASCAGNALTEISIATKQIVNELDDPRYEFNCPDAFAFDGVNIWVANWRGNSLTEIDGLTGILIRNVTGSYVQDPVTLAVVGTNLWVGDHPTSGAGTFLTILNVSTGALVRKLTQGQLGPHWRVNWPSCMVAARSDIWISDQDGSNVSEFNGLTGAYLRHTVNVSAGGVGLYSVGCVSYHGGLLWASGSGSHDLVEYKSSTGAYVRNVQVEGPSQLLFTGSDLFAILTVPAPNYSVREYNADGKFIRTILNTRIEGGYGLTALASDGRNLWIANYAANTVSYYALR